jgi:IclR family transcriptional regulator, KDG regulon repressor
MMIGSISNAVNIIECFTVENSERGVSEISSQLNMNKSTVHHIIKTLHSEGILVRTPSRKYRLGSRLLGWGERVSKQYSPLYNAAPYLDELVRKTNETVHLAVQENDKVSYLAKVEPKRPVKIKTSIGTHSPIHCTGLGKALLATQPGLDYNKVYDIPLESRTEYTITNHDQLVEELEKSAQQGYSIDNQEYEIGLYCIAVPIKNFMGDTVAAISISGPEFRMHNQNIDVYITQLQSISRKISEYCEL